MNSLPSEATMHDPGRTPGKKTGPPFSDLHIYYLEGSARSAETFFDRRFIGNWEEDGFSFLFFSEPDDDAVSAFVEGCDGLSMIDKYEMTYEQWQGGRFSSSAIGGFMVRPPWEFADGETATGDGKTIVLDPGVVFGNGLHPTTRDCIEALELVYSREIPKTALDLGCGTGILALAAVRLGCEKCLAVDFNLLAAKTTRRNVVLNGLEDKIATVHGDAVDFIDLPAPLVIANIHFDVMEKLLLSDGFFRKKRFVLSGLLRSQAGKAEELLRRGGAAISKTWERDGVWHTFLGENP